MKKKIKEDVRVQKRNKNFLKKKKNIFFFQRPPFRWCVLSARFHTDATKDFKKKKKTWREAHWQYNKSTESSTRRSIRNIKKEKEKILFIYCLSRHDVILWHNVSNKKKKNDRKCPILFRNRLFWLFIYLKKN
jgi:hypothetical protein